MRKKRRNNKKEGRKGIGKERTAGKNTKEKEK